VVTFNASVAASGTVQVPATGGTTGVPADASQVLMKLSVVGVQSGYLSAYPCGASRPTVTNVDYVAGSTGNNLAMIAPGTSGQICVFAANGSVRLTATVIGYIPSGGSLVKAGPTRIYDSRTANGPTVAGQTRSITVTGLGGVPTAARSVAVNIVATGASSAGSLTAWACDAPRPAVKQLDYLTGARQSAALTVVALSASGTLCLSTTTATQVMIEVQGFYGVDGMTTEQRWWPAPVGV
jgi:hypothetical protein